MKFLKKLFYSALVGIPLFFAGKKVTAQEIAFEFSDPFKNSVTNTIDDDSISTLSGEGLEFLMKKFEIDNVPSRLFETLFSYGVNSLNSVISHEMGHYRFADKFGLDPEISIKPFSGIVYHSGLCSWEGDSSDKEYSQIASAGNNQNTLNASHVWEKMQIKSHKIYDDVNFIVNKYLPVLYNWRSIMNNFESRSDDFSHYFEAMSYMNFQIDHKKAMLNNTILSLANTQLYNSLYSIINFIATGDRNSKSLTFKIGDTEITPPLFDYFLTERGEFFNTSVVINPNGKIPVKIEYGSDLDFTQEKTDVNRQRFGLTLYNIPVGDSFISPFIYVNTDNNFKPNGVYMGLTAEKSICENLSLRIKMEYNQDDIIQKSVKGEDNDSKVSIGIVAKLGK